MRKAYLRLSLALHPDRLGRRFKDATKAFQVG
jgi:curved DNA-binding protein CbpA